MNLTDFLLARIAEDEDYARTMDQVGKDMAASEMEPGTDVLSMVIRTLSDPRVMKLMAAWSETGVSMPNSMGRVLAECEAKRRIVEEWQRFEDENHRAYGANPTSSIIARALALPYKDHPDFQQEWSIG